MPSFATSLAKETVKAGLGRGIVRVEGRGALKGRLRSEVEDVAALLALLDPVVAQPAVGEEYAVEVDGNAALPFGERNVHHLVGGPGHGRVNENVDAAELFEHEIEELVDLVFLGSIGLELVGAALAARGDHVGQRFVGLLIVRGIGDNDLGAFLYQAQAAGAADVGRTADHHCHFIFESQIHGKPLSSLRANTLLDVVAGNLL